MINLNSIHLNFLEIVELSVQTQGKLLIIRLIPNFFIITYKSLKIHKLKFDLKYVTLIENWSLINFVI